MKSRSVFDHRYLVVCSLISFLLLGLGLRAYNLNRRGIIEHDEGHYLLASQLYSRSAFWAVSQSPALRAGTAILKELRDAVIAEGGGTQNLTAKPMHYLVIAIALWIGNFSDTATLIPSAFFGTLTLMVVFMLGRKMFGISVALLATLVLAVSAYHIFYSRSAIPQAGSVFFDCLGIYLYYRSTRRVDHELLLLFLAGLSIAVAFAFHYNLFWEFLAILLYEGWRWLEPRQVYWKRLFVVLAGFAIPILGIELIFQSIRFLLSRVAPTLLAGLTFKTYFEQIDYQIHFNVERGFSPDLLFYPKLFWNWEGPLVCIILFLGLLLVAKRLLARRELADLIVLAQFCLPFILWNTNSSQYPRSMVVALPFVALITASGLGESVKLIPAQTKYRNAALLLVTLAILVIGISKSLPIVRGTSGYADAASQLRRYAETHPGTIVAKKELGLSTDPLWRFYLGNLVDYDLERGTVFIVDRSAYVSSYGNTAALLEEVRCAQPIIQQANDITWYLIGDSPTNPPEQVVQQIAEANEIRLYDRRVHAAECK